MKRPNAPSRDDWMDTRVEAYVDGDLSDKERERFERMLDNSTYWQAQVRQAKRIRQSLRSFPTKEAPASLTQEIFHRTSRAHQPLSWWRSLLQQMMQNWRALVAARRRPVVDYGIGLAFVAMVAVFIFVPMERSGPTTQSASQVDVQSTSHPAPSPEGTVAFFETLGHQASSAVTARLQHAFGAPAPTDSATTAADDAAPEDGASDAPTPEDTPDDD